MVKTHPHINVLSSHTKLDFLSKENKDLKVKTLSIKDEKYIWQIFFKDTKGISSAVIKSSKVPQSLIEYEIYKGSIPGLEKFLPKTYGQWKEAEFNFIVMEHVNVLSKFRSLKSQKNIIELIAKLHAQFPENKVNVEWMPNWRNFNSKNLKNYFLGLEQELENKNLQIPISYATIIQKGMKLLPQLFKETQKLQYSLIHGDVHRINSGMNSSKKVVLIDWENAQVGPSTFDIVWLLERSLAYCSEEDEHYLRQWGISSYLKALEKHGILREEKSFLLEYKLIYIYLVLTSFIWNYTNKFKKSKVLDYHLRTFSRCANELNIF